MLKRKLYTNTTYEKKHGFDIPLNQDGKKLKSSGLEKAKPKSKDDEKEKISSPFV